MSKILAQYFELYIGGVKLGEYWLDLIDEIVFEDTCTGSDLLTITLSDPELEILSSRYVFIEEQTVVFVGGYTNSYRTLFQGYISVIDVDFPQDGTPKLTISCMDNTHLMNREKKSRSWTNAKASNVVREIFTSYGFKSVVDDSLYVEDTISQSNQSDIEFLCSLADDMDDTFFVFIEGDIGYFVRKNAIESPQDTITYRDSDFKLIDFSPRISKEQKQERISASDVNSNTGTVDTGEATDSIEREISGDPVQTSSDKTDTSGGDSHKYIGHGQWT